MYDSLNDDRTDFAFQAGRLAQLVDLLEDTLNLIADGNNARQAQVWARQGLDKIARIRAVDQHDPDVPKPRYPSESVDHAAELRIETYRAETGAPWGGGI